MSAPHPETRGGRKKRGEEGVEEMGEEIKEKGEITLRQRAYGTRGE